MEEAELLMKEIEVNVWKINSRGEKYASTTSFTVHKDIADIVYDVFQEIFEGDEKFPILWVGGYAWRGGKSEHNWGMALDINPDQNYCIYTSGAVVGDFWLPYENPYSITPYGDVINAFENHGFTWGGDAWSRWNIYKSIACCIFFCVWFDIATAFVITAFCNSYSVFAGICNFIPRD